MFSIDREKFGTYTLIKLVNQETDEFFSFIPDYGATMNQLTLKGKDGVNHSLLYENVDYNNLITEGTIMYKGSKLVPFPNRINSGIYSFGSKNYQLPLNEIPAGNAIHGLIFESNFTVVKESASDKEAFVAVEYLYQNEKEGYPFKFRITIIFRLDKKGFICRTIIKNEDNQEIPLGDGWHPYFRINNTINDLYLHIPSYLEIELNENKIPTGKVKFNETFKTLSRIGEYELDTCFKLKDEEDLSVIQLVDKSKDLNVNIWMESMYKYIQVYTPNTRKCIAIEPMTCIPDAFNNKIDLIVIPPDKSLEFVWGINLYQ